MSRHLANLPGPEGPIPLVTGFDRPLRQFFLKAWHGSTPQIEGEGAASLLYNSLHKPELDWSDIGPPEQRVLDLGIEAPAAMIEAIYLNQVFNAGNRIVRHHLDGPSELLFPG